MEFMDASTVQWPQMEDDHQLFNASIHQHHPRTTTNSTNNNVNANPNAAAASAAEGTATTTTTGGAASGRTQAIRPAEQLKCPRCNSNNTKFCYYNNYSLTQPRYFCKTCRRYWTEGGSLRNVPVGGGSRKNKLLRSSSSSSTSASMLLGGGNNNQLPAPAAAAAAHHHHHLYPNNNNSFHYEGQGQDLNLGGYVNHHHQMIPTKIDSNNNINATSSSSSSTSSTSLPALDLLRRGIISSRPRGGIINYFIPAGPDQSNTSLYSSSKLLFPMSNRNGSSSSDHHQADVSKEPQGQGGCSTSTGCWSGVLGGGSSW